MRRKTGREALQEEEQAKALGWEMQGSFEKWGEGCIEIGYRERIKVGKVGRTHQPKAEA